MQLSRERSRSSFKNALTSLSARKASLSRPAIVGSESRSDKDAVSRRFCWLPTLFPCCDDVDEGTDEVL